PFSCRRHGGMRWKGPTMACWLRKTILAAILLLAGGPWAPAAAFERHPVPREHPRLLGSREHLQALARERSEAYQRVVRVARESEADDHAKMISMALVAAVESDETLAEAAKRMAMKYVDGPIRKGHVTFGSDLARCAVVYDLCHDKPKSPSRPIASAAC
ncbi:MAG: hypothetical protein ABIP48_24940, partial [Planctomycetota bacterium]